MMTRQGFGTADIGMVAYECPEKAGMHLVDEAIVQVCDPQTGAPLPVGQIGEIVATVHNRTYPMIRFGTGDLTVITGRAVPVRAHVRAHAGLARPSRRGDEGARACSSIRGRPTTWPAA